MHTYNFIYICSNYITAIYREPTKEEFNYMVQELAKVRALQLGYHINGASPALLAFKPFGGKPLSALNVPEFTPLSKPGVTTKTSNDVVINASQSKKRGDSRLFAFDSDDDNDEPVSRPQSTGSTTKRKSSMDPNQEPTEVDIDYIHHRFSIALHLLHFAKKFPSPLKVYCAEKNSKWKKTETPGTPTVFLSRFYYYYILYSHNYHSLFQIDTTHLSI